MKASPKHHHSPFITEDDNKKLVWYHGQYVIKMEANPYPCQYICTFEEWRDHLAPHQIRDMGIK